MSSGKTPAGCVESGEGGLGAGSGNLREAGVLGLGERDSIKHGRAGFTVKVALERSVGVALQVADKEPSGTGCRWSSGPKAGFVWRV